MTSQTFSELLGLLPETPRPGMLEAAMESDPHGIGQNLMLYAREPYAPETDPWPWEDAAERRRGWAARCTCTSCGNETISGWGKGGSVRALIGDDGQIWNGIPWEEHGTEVIELREGDRIGCPWCGAEVTYRRKSSVKNGLTRKLMVCSVECVGALTALVWWLCEKAISPWGGSSTECLPVSAAVILTGGELACFRRCKFDLAGRLCAGETWSETKQIDPDFAKYYDAESINRKRMGAWMWRSAESQIGRSGEKTGLKEYLEAGGEFPLLYLRFWREHRAIENLVKAGWTKAISGSIEQEADRCGGLGIIVRDVKCLESIFFWDAGERPCDLLQMEKQEAWEAAAWNWDNETLTVWADAVGFGITGPGSARAFQSGVESYGLANVSQWIGGVEDGEDWRWDEDEKYLRRQQRKHGLPLRQGMELLLDYRYMIDEYALEAEGFPNNLQRTHDELVKQLKLDADGKLRRGFERVLDEWGGLEWTDGEICIRLPRSPEELVREGTTLQHCVGTYGKRHISGGLILFVRHHRRPERSWYTLNEDVSGKTPKRVQLHGYKNELVRGKQLKIPARVRKAVETWEKEVLEPEFWKVMQRREAKSA